MKLQLALDVGHSSIGWAVLNENITPSTPPALAGCGVVLFEKDSALAIQRRGYRQQRRHVRATRTRIARLERLIEHIGALPPQEIAARHGPGSGHPAPWQLAASVLVTKGAAPLNWSELWAVLRWYAHNRGYEPWGETDENDPEADDDTEKVETAKAALAHYGTSSMAETVCRWLGIEPTGPLRFSHDPAKNLRQQKAAFPRDVVRREVRDILTALLAHHAEKLPGLDETFITALLDDARAIACPAIKLPLRYRGGLLFGRLQMRYDNRIISRCVHTATAIYAKHRAAGKNDTEARRLAARDAKVPAKKCPEFLNYRWAMLLANLRIATADTGELRPLNPSERATLHAQMVSAGRMTKTELRSAVRALPGWQRDSFDQLLLVPEADKALLLDPVAELIADHRLLAAVWPVLPLTLQNRTRKRWWRTDPGTGRAHSTTLAVLRAELPVHGGDVAAFDAALTAAQATTPKSKPRARPKAAAKIPASDTPPADPLSEPLHIRKALRALTGRAPYARPLLAQAFAEVMSGGDPKAKGGCLEETEAVRAYREGRPFDQQTNNHLIRHRLLILDRLIRDLVADSAYGAGDASRFTRVTIEVNRELRDHSGLTAQDIAKDLGLRLSSHTKAVEWLEAYGLQPTGSLIRKARVALDLDLTCPYTGHTFEAAQIRDGRVDLDHIIPRSLRPSDSLDSLALTFPAVNRWKGARTAWQFVQDCGGQAVPREYLTPGDPKELHIATPEHFKKFVLGLNTKGHDDDVRRKRRRKEFFLLERYEEKDRDFTPGQLTQTSQLTRLARIAVRRHLRQLGDHDFIALPGSVTGAVRKAWNLMGCLATVSPEIVGSDGKLLPKDDIRGITHLHHALDAVTLGYATALLPNNGSVWKLLSLRKIPADQREFFHSALPVEIDGEGRWRLRSLLENHPAIDQQIRARLAERRVVQHVPADMGGMGLEQNTWRVMKIDGDRVHLRQKSPRNAKGVREVPYKHDEIETEKAFGLKHGRLHAVKGVRVLGGNFAIVILTAPQVPEDQRIQIVRHNQVFKVLGELRKTNGGQSPLLFRSGSIIDVPRGNRKGRWRIVSPKKSEAYGLSLDLAAIDGVRLGKGNAPVIKLMQDGMQLVKTNYTGATLA